MQHVDIAIVGGGIVGLTLAAALKHSELSIAIVDKAVCYEYKNSGIGSSG